MTAFVPIAHLDVYDLACSLRRHAGLYRPQDDGTHVLMLHGPREGAEDPDDDSAYAWKKVAPKWQEFLNTFERIKRLGAERIGEVAFGRIFVEMLPAGAHVPWRRDESEYAGRFLRAHLPLWTNPSCLTLCGAETRILLPGELTIVSRAGLCSAINAGSEMRAHLVVDFRGNAVVQ